MLDGEGLSFIGFEISPSTLTTIDGKTFTLFQIRPLIQAYKFVYSHYYLEVSAILSFSSTSYLQTYIFQPSILRSLSSSTFSNSKFTSHYFFPAKLGGLACLLMAVGGVLVKSLKDWGYRREIEIEARELKEKWVNETIEYMERL
jgi:hypothetical protein